MHSLWQQAIKQVVGDDALNLEELAKKRRRDDAESMGLGDFFFDPGDDLNPDKETPEES